MADSIQVKVVSNKAAGIVLNGPDGFRLELYVAGHFFAPSMGVHEAGFMPLETAMKTAGEVAGALGVDVEVLRCPTPPTVP